MSAYTHKTQKPHLLVRKMSGFSWRDVALATQLSSVLQLQGVAEIAPQRIWHTRATAHVHTRAAHLHIQRPLSSPVRGPSEPKM